MRFFSRVLVTIIAGFALVIAGCGDDGDPGPEVGADPEQPTIVVTTNILGDVVENLVGSGFNVVTIMPVGAAPHDFPASAQQVAEIGEADVLIANGAGFEEGLVDVIEAAEGDGVPVFEAISAVETIELGPDGHDHADEEDHTDEGEHADEGIDPHFFTDPARMALVADSIAEFLMANIDGIDSDAMNVSADGYVDQLEALDAALVETLDVIDEEHRVLVTNHEVFGYFADRYDFEVVGTVIPTGTTVDGVSAQELAELAELIEHEGVPAIFADTSSSDELARTLADEVGDIEVVELFSESLGSDDSDGATYIDMVRSNAQHIVDALAG